VAIQPSNPGFRANYALFAMYAGDYPLARREAEILLADYPEYFLGYIPLAIAALAEGDASAAESHYLRMAEIGERAASFAVTGRADIAMMSADYEASASLLREGMETDRVSGNTQGAAHKGVYLAVSEHRLGNSEYALTILDEVLPTTDNLSHLLPAALLLVDMGQTERAHAIQQQLEAKLNQSSRAAADGIAGALALSARNAVAAIDAFNASLERTDSWLGRFLLGHAYAGAGYFPEALGEFEKCEDRLGESSAIFLDDVPTFHYSADLQYWLGYTKQQLGMRREALDNYQRFLSQRSSEDDSDMARAAREQIATLTP
jgi:tetratricopeptide (TPR) repeat protein